MPADPPQRHLQDRRRLLGEHGGELVLGRQPFSGGDGDAGLAGDAGHLVDVLGRHRLLEPQGVEGLQPPGEADGAGRGHLAVGAEQQVAGAADGLADGLHEVLAVLQRLEGKLPGIERGKRADRVELDRGEAHGDVLGGACRGQVRVAVDAVALALGGIEVGIRPQPVVDPATEKLVDGLVEFLADDVPAGRLDAAENPHHRRIGPHGVAAAVDVSPQPLDLERVGADDAAFAQVLDHARDRMGVERYRIDLADALDPAVGRELHEHPVDAAEMGRRIAHNEGLVVGDFHARRYFPRSPAAVPSR